MNDLLWADPFSERNRALTEREAFNECRRTSVKFGNELLTDLLDGAKLKALVRAHEEEPEGFKLHLWGTTMSSEPRCITIFSAPNYCNHDNDGAVLLVDPGDQTKVLCYGPAPYQMYYLKDRDDGLITFLPAVVEEVNYLWECIF